MKVEYSDWPGNHEFQAISVIWSICTEEITVNFIGSRIVILATDLITKSHFVINGQQSLWLEGTGSFPKALRLTMMLFFLF